MSFWKGFLFTHSQKIGLLGLIGIVVVGIFGTAWFRYHRSQPKEIQIALSLPPSPELELPATREGTRRIDINLADSAEWDALRGIGPVLSGRIIRFRKARHGFRSIGDLKQVYGLKPETFEQIRPFLFVEEATIPLRKQASSPRYPSSRPKPDIPEPIDVNQADSETFQRLKGIGPVLGDRIVKYRTALGGFRQVEQIQQVYGLKPEVFEKIRKSLFVAATGELIPTPIAQADKEKDSLLANASNKRMVQPEKPKDPTVSVSFDLNLVDSAQLVQLPGIGAWTASQILTYRTRMGHYIAIEQLRDIPRLKEHNYEKMIPFLRVENLDRFPKRDLNRASEWMLKVHRPVGDSLASLLIRHRKDLGRFSSWQELREIDRMEDATISYLRKYFHL